MNKVLIHKIREKSPNYFVATDVEEEFENHPTLEEMKAMVGDGWIEHIKVIHEGEDCDALINEDGKRLELPVNPIATEKYHAWLAKNQLPLEDIIVGDCAICTNFNLE